MKLVISSDFSGFFLKEAVRRHLEEIGHEVYDAGQKTEAEKMVYVDAVTSLVKVFFEGNYARGIVFCGTGAGVSIVANKHRGIYCVPCESIFTASRSPVINNANLLAMGANVVGPENACRMADIWLQQSFCGDLPPERAAFISELFQQVQKVENRNFATP